MNNSDSNIINPQGLAREKTGGMYFVVSAIIIGVLIIVANSLVLVLYKCSHGLRTFSNFLLVNLALSDLVTGLLVIPLTLLQAHINFDATFLFFVHAFTSAGIYTVVLNITMVVLERYMELCHPYWSGRMRVIQYKKVVCIVPWVLVNAVAVLPYIWYNQVQDNYNLLKSDTIYSLLTLIFFFLLPLSVIIWAMVRMMACIREVQRRCHLHMCVFRNRDAKAVIIFGLMTLNSLIAWLPFAIIRILDDANINIAMNALGAELLFLLRCLSSLINPLVYTGIKQDFRRVLKRMIKTNFPSREHGRRTRYHLRNKVNRDNIIPQGSLNLPDRIFVGRKHSNNDYHAKQTRDICETEV